MRRMKELTTDEQIVAAASFCNYLLHLHRFLSDKETVMVKNRIEKYMSDKGVKDTPKTEIQLSINIRANEKSK